MGLQYISCPSNALFMLGILQIVGYLEQRMNIVNDVFGDFFINPETEDGWNKIQQIIEPHGLAKIMLTGATPSKPIRQNDGMVSPFLIERQHANLCMMYETADSLGNIKDPEYEYLRTWWNPQDMPIQNQEATLRWNAIISAYEIIHEIEATTALMLESIKPLYYSNNVYTKTPMQIQFFSGDMMHGAFIKPDALSDVSWTTIDQFKTDDLNNPGIIDIIFNFPLDKLWYIPVPILTFSSGADTFPGCDPLTTFVLSSASDCFYKTGFFTPDDSPDGATGSVIPDLFQASLWRTTIMAGSAGSTGTVSINYKRLIVT